MRTLTLAIATDIARLADAVALSASRVTRLVDDLGRRGWVDRERDPLDARGAVATLTRQGEERRRAARPQQILSARRHLLDHVPPPALHELGQILQQVAEEASGHDRGQRTEPADPR